MSQSFQVVEPDYLDYLRDESRLNGSASKIAFPTDEQEVQALLSMTSAEGDLVTVQGARTGICGGGVPQGGVILNLSRMNRVLAAEYDWDRSRVVLRVQPGVLLSDLNERLGKKELPLAGGDEGSLSGVDKLIGAAPLFFPPDPTETGASLGGMVASNASGARSYAYGPTRAHIRALRLALADGTILCLSRSPSNKAPRASGLQFTLTADNGHRFEGQLPSYRMPDTKNAAGLYAKPGMEMIDLAIGCEGTIGVLTEMEILLSETPAAIIGLLCFFDRLPSALEFVRDLQQRAPIGQMHTCGALEGIAAIEFFDQAALDLLRGQKQNNPAFADLPQIPTSPEAAIYVEIHAHDKARCDDIVVALANRLSVCGGDEEETWIAEHARELARLKDFRHALPEAVNLMIDERRRTEPRLIKLGTDMAVPAASLEGTIDMYRSGLAAAGLEAVMFGHIGANHVHVNILPRNIEEYQRGRRLYDGWAQAAVRMGGTVSAEHGIGKLKVELLRAMYGRQGLQEMRRTIEVFNPGFRLNRGNMVGDQSN